MGKPHPQQNTWGERGDNAWGSECRAQRQSAKKTSIPAPDFQVWGTKVAPPQSGEKKPTANTQKGHSGRSARISVKKGFMGRPNRNAPRGEITTKEVFVMCRDTCFRAEPHAGGKITIVARRLQNPESLPGVPRNGADFRRRTGGAREVPS